MPPMRSFEVLPGHRRTLTVTNNSADRIFINVPDINTDIRSDAGEPSWHENEYKITCEFTVRAGNPAQAIARAHASMLNPGTIPLVTIALARVPESTGPSQ